jgi:predicted nucleic acid-binding Zn ribbon protein
MDRSEAARLLAQRPVVGQTQCVECGAPIPLRAGVAHQRRYCSARCRVRVYYRTHKAERAAYQRQYRARKRPAVPVEDSSP